MCSVQPQSVPVIGGAVQWSALAATSLSGGVSYVGHQQASTNDNCEEWM